MDHACNTWLIDNTLPPTSPRELADIVLAFASTRVKKHDEFLHILTDEIEVLLMTDYHDHGDHITLFRTTLMNLMKMLLVTLYEHFYLCVMVISSSSPF